VEGGVEMLDILNYKVPLGFLGTIADHLFVRSRIEQIFEYRRKRILELFPVLN